MEDTNREMFRHDLMSITDQADLEEAEELEECRHREEEIHNLLSHAMGDFNYDEQSTFNISGASNELIHHPNSSMLEQKYCEADANEQLKVLYEVRVREVVALQKELEKLQEESKQQEGILKKKVILLEAENERKNVSLQESQKLLTEKVDLIRNLENRIESVQNKSKDLQFNVKDLNQEIAVLREANLKLEQQVGLMEKGFPLLNKINDKEVHESLRQKITQLEDALENTRQHIENREHNYKQAACEFAQSLQEKDNLLAENNLLIMKLTENYESVQRQHRDLLKSMEELKQSKKETPLEEELRRIRERNEGVDVLSETVRKAVSNEFQEQITNLTAENIRLKDTLCDKEKQTDLVDSLKIENNVLKNNIKELENKIKCYDNQNNILEEELKILNANYRQLQNDNEKIGSDKNLQTSLLGDDLTSFQDELEAARATIEKLETTVAAILQENSELKTKVDLEHERDRLINRLQEKAAQFEAIILEKQKKLSEMETNSIGVNTIPEEGTSSILKIKYDASLFEMEAKLRKKLKEEFDGKLEKLMMERKPEKCDSCKGLRQENENLMRQRSKDRECVAKLVEMWTHKFDDFEKETRDQMVAVEDFYKQNINEQVMAYRDTYKKLIETMKVLSVDVGNKNNKLVQQNISALSLINERINKIDKKFKRGTEEIKKIEKQYSERNTKLEKI